MSTMVYKCPGCGASLEFDGESGKLLCSCCGTGFMPEELPVDEQDEWQEAFAENDARFDGAEGSGISTYHCESCGAQLATDEQTTAVQCAYCGSTTILPERIRGGVLPEKIVPFTVSKEQAQEAFLRYFKGQKLMPDWFSQSHNRISEIRKLYVPYYLFDCEAHGTAVYDCEKTRTEREEEWEVTHTAYYEVRRMGDMAFENVPADGSSKLDDRITESIEPYDMSAAIPFEPAHLAGALADCADVEEAACIERIKQRVHTGMKNALRESVSGYTTVRERFVRVDIRDGKVTPVLLPVWLITTEKTVKGEKKTYTFAINGQTGKLTCDIPADGKKMAMWLAGTFASIGAIGYGLIVLLKLLGVIA